MTTYTGYQPPSRLYLAGIMDQLRKANRAATLASNTFNEVANALEEKARIDSQRAGDKPEVTALKVRGARAGNTDLADCDRQYKFWAGEVDRLSAVILCERAMMEMMHHAEQV